jgi:hypothetical protein
MKTTYKPTKSIVETINESRERFRKAYGRLLTEEEAIQLTDEIRAEIRRENENNERPQKS